MPATEKFKAEWRDMPSQQRGRKTAYTEALGKELCDHVADGNTVISWCRKRQIRPQTVNKWMDKIPGFEVSLARARRSQYDAMADECVAIADEEFETNEQVQRARLRVETRLKLLAKWDPQRYGDRLIEDKEVRVTVTVNDPTASVRASRIIEHEVSDNATQTRRIAQDDQQ
jgi:hypothetical protein